MIVLMIITYVKGIEIMHVYEIGNVKDFPCWKEYFLVIQKNCGSGKGSNELAMSSRNLDTNK
jgi:hypothetical protein